MEKVNIRVHYHYYIYAKINRKIDSFYQGFSAEVESEQCGWIVDKYGISWQIVPRMFLDFATKLSPTTYQKINQQILTMKKIEIAQIEKLI